MGLLHAVGVSAARKVRMLLLFASLAGITWVLLHLTPLPASSSDTNASSNFPKAKGKAHRAKSHRLPQNSVNSPYNTSKVALLIEPRPIPHLAPLILHMISVAPSDWPFVFVGSDSSVAMVNMTFGIQSHRKAGKLTLTVLPPPWKLQTKEDAFWLLTDMRFYSQFFPGVDWIFKYEHDSILCANSNSSLDDWLSWGWGGATRGRHDGFSGSGGLSIRSVSAIKQILGYQAHLNNTEPEDVWFGKRLSAPPEAKTTSRTEAGGVFTAENVFTERPMGFHVPAASICTNDDLWNNPARRRSILEYCPEISLIIDMKLERERCPDDDMHGQRLPPKSEWAFRADQGVTTDSPMVIWNGLQPPQLLTTSVTRAEEMPQKSSQVP